MAIYIYRLPLFDWVLTWEWYRWIRGRAGREGPRTAIHWHVWCNLRGPLPATLHFTLFQNSPTRCFFSFYNRGSTKCILFPSHESNRLQLWFTLIQSYVLLLCSVLNTVIKEWEKGSYLKSTMCGSYNVVESLLKTNFMWPKPMLILQGINYVSFLFHLVKCFKS